MARKPSFTCKRTPAGWKVEIPSSLSQSGKRERAFFSSRDKARDFAADLQEKFKESGSLATAIKPSLAEAAVEAARILEPTGIGLIEAAREVRKRWDAARTSERFDKAVAQYLLTCEGLRENTLQSYRYTLEKTAAPLLAGRMLSDITLADLQSVVSSKAPTSARMHKRNLSAFWRWAAKAPRKWCDRELLDGLETPRVHNDADIAILHPDDVRALLAAAEAESPAAAVSFAIAIFAGVRMAELERLKWRDIRDDHIEISKDVAKKHLRRMIPICSTLRAWIDTYRGDTGSDTRIIPGNWPDVSKLVRRLAGWDVAARSLGKRVAEGRMLEPPAPTRGRWPSNACRHTCASLQVAIGTSLETLVFSFGHSGGHDLLRRHYVSRMTKKEAIAILSVGPKGRKVENLKSA